MEPISEIARSAFPFATISRISLLLLAASGQLAALDPGIRLDQLYHTGWTVKDGAPSGAGAITQTADGFLWFGTPTSLYRFDGVRFEQYDRSPNVPLGKSGGGTLMGLPDGGLLVSWYNGFGVSLLADGHFIDYGPDSNFPPNSGAAQFQIAPGPTIWASAFYGKMLWLDPRGHWHDAPEWPNGASQPRFFSWDREGILWVLTKDALYYRESGETKFHKIRATGLTVAQTPDGTRWLQAPNGIRAFDRKGIGTATLRPPPGQKFGYYLLADRQGNLWSAGNEQGILRFVHPERGLAGATIQAEPFAAKDGLTSDIVTGAFEDREGNIWITTALGVDMFRQSTIVPSRLPKSRNFTFLDASANIQVASELPGRIFTVNHETVVHSESLPVDTFSALPSARGAIWLGTLDRGVVQYLNGKLKPEKSPGTSIGATSTDHSGRLWVRVNAKGFFRRENDTWTRLTDLGSAPTLGGGPVFTDSFGRVWFGFTDNRLYMLDGESLTEFTAADGVGTGVVLEVAEAGGTVFISGPMGLEAFDGQKFIPVIPNDTDSFRTVWGLLASRRSGLWFMEDRGIVHISEAEVYQVTKNPKHQVAYELLGVLDGLPSALQRNGNRPSSIEDSGGRVWFATDTDIVWIDPSRTLVNRVIPGVVIQAISANGKTYHSMSSLRLPARTTDARITFTATSLTIPERVRFRYQLEKVDRTWKDSGTRREASYTNLGPGFYRFRVIACNNDGIWNETGTVASFTIAPTFYQTVEFKFLSALVGGAVLWVCYRLRLRQVAAAMGARFDDRLAERTRIARDFHDTLLQTLQGSKMVADDALAADGDPSQVRRAMVLVAGWLGQAIQEGREALSSLRSSTTEDNDLSAALRRAGEESSSLRSIAFDLSVEGPAKRMHPIARDEVYRIGYEAIRNACSHSGATGIDVTISYLQDFVLRVKDNGNGFESSAVSLKPGLGHFGVIGMYERAGRIRGKLTISSSPGSGTDVELVVPRTVIFLDQRSTPKLPKWRDVWQ